MTNDRKTALHNPAATRWVGLLLIAVGILASLASDALSHWSCEVEWGDDCEMAPDMFAPFFFLFAVPFVLAGAWMLFKPSTW